MPTLRRLSYIAFGVACAHLIFGAIVRISGSGMGCGDHWPLCYGRLFPPMNRPDLIIEVSHRYLASLLLLSLIVLLVAAWRRRDQPGVGGPGGVLRSSALAVALGVAAALLGAVTVKLGNIPLATLAHWTVAMSLVATVVATVIRAGGFGGETALAGGVSPRTRRATFAAAAMALAAVVMGGLTAKYPGAAVACPSFPMCGTNPDVQGAAVHVQITHRVIAVLLVLHLFGLVMAQRKRQEAPLIRRALTIAFSLGVLQLLVAGAMIGMHLPPILRSLHEAIGVSIWIATFALAYLARIASGGAAGPRTSQYPIAPEPDELSDEGVVRVTTPSRQVFATAVAESDAVADALEPWQTASDEEWVAEVAEPVAESPAVIAEVPEVVAESPAVVEKVPEVVAESPEVVEKVPEVVAESPEVVAKVLEVVAETPAVVEIVPEVVAETPAVVEIVPEVVAETPAVVAEGPVIVAEGPFIVSEAPFIVADAPVIVAEAPEVITGTAAVVTEDPVIVAEDPVIVGDAPVIVADAQEIIAKTAAVVAEDPVIVAETPFIVAEAPAIVVAAVPAAPRNTMRHTVAVIVARGADL